MIQSPSLVEMLSSYTAVVATQLDNQCRGLLAEVCWQLNIPLFLVHTNGMIGTLRSQFQDHPVVESKPETDFYDMRLSAPWEELLSLSSEIDLASLDDEHHSHVPWVFIVVQLVQEFVSEHGKKPGFGDRGWFEAAIGSMRRVEDQQNLVQAKANLRAALMPLSRIMCDEAREVFEAASEQCSKHPGSKFWVVAKAISDFMENEPNGLPPLAGRIPDMVSDTESYIKLQALYQSKAEADFNSILKRVREILTDTGCSPETVPAAHVRLMCLNVNSLRVVRTGCVSEDLVAPNKALTEKLTSWDAADANSIWVLLFRAVDNFHTAHARFPGGSPGSYADDVPLLKAAFNVLVTDMQLTEALQGWRTAHPNVDLEDLLNECCRFGNSQLHAVAAVMGGIVSQEVLKVVTEQFLPLNNFLVYNAIDSTTMTMAPVEA
eukprot:TRINITY_DN12427_c0_g1_i2.p1 TRINITY_DN12427_c0_g1~~TRINITY_DN12427_c0_g1_i2.p1  ORF type:complete len:434 (+),score=112.86 TRINITY_DN12427_c0_g1_i2:261-1562(+)